MSATPGPWFVYHGPEDHPELTVLYEDKSGQLIEVADCLSSTVPPTEREANARFIAAAPDLLAALKVAIQVMKDNDIDEALSGEFDQFEDAIAKAEGPS